MNRRQAFTILEILIAVTILAFASMAIGWKTYRMIERYRFQSDVKRVQSAFQYAKMLAMNTRADWVWSLMKYENGWQALLICREDPDRLTQFSTPMRFQPYTFSFDGESLVSFAFVFYSTGHVEPQGILELQTTSTEKMQVKLSVPTMELLSK